jgi:hypothetical protein
MKAPRLVSLAAGAAVFLYLGCLPAAAETAAAPQENASSIKPIMEPPAAKKKTASTRASHRKTAAKDSVHVYLFRGLLNVFSLGMDELADKIRATGIAATVYNHTEWEEVAGQIAANYKNGNHAPIILIGHSLGADAVMFMAASLGKRGVPVALVVPFDGTQTLVAPSNVARVLNLTQRDYAYARRGFGFHGELKNLDVSGEGVDHLNIDKSPRLHALVLSTIAAVVKRGEVPSSFATVSPEEKEQAKPMPKPAPAEVAAKPEPSHEKSAADVAAKPAAEAPKAEAAPALRSGEMVSPPAPESPAVSTATAAPQPVSVPAAVVPQPMRAPAQSAPQPASVTPAKPVAIPPPDRLEYEKLVLPKR